MKSLRALSLIEAQDLGNVLKNIREEWGFSKSVDLDYLLQRWGKFVEEVERGYALQIEDYTQDLSIRDILEKIKSAVPVALRQNIGCLLDPLDERFRQATCKSDRPIDLPLEENAGEWWFRIPLSAGPELGRYLLEGDKES